MAGHKADFFQPDDVSIEGKYTARPPAKYRWPLCAFCKESKQMQGWVSRPKRPIPCLNHLGSGNPALTMLLRLKIYV